MCGTPQKMLEHLLETRMGIQVGPNDPFLDDFLLTHVVFMPIPVLVEELRKQYPFQYYLYLFIYIYSKIFQPTFSLCLTFFPLHFFFLLNKEKR